MASQDFSPSVITTSSSAILYPSLIQSDDNNYAKFPLNSTPSIYARFNASLPTDSLLTGIQVFYSARTSGTVANASLTFNYFLDSSLTEVATGQVSSAISSSEASGSVGGSALLFGYDLRRQDVHSNSWFGITIKPTAAVTGHILLDHIYLRLHYTSYNYLVGSRSNFMGRPGDPYDVIMVNGVASDASSLVPRKYNSAAPENQVKSEHLNLLGDALYNIESVIVDNPDLVRSVGLQKMYAFSVTITGNTLGSSACTFSKIRLNGTDYENLFNITGANRTKSPNIPDRIDCHWTSAIGWVTSGSTKIPIYVHSNGAYFEKNLDNTVDFVLNLTAVGSGIYATKTDYDLNASTATSFDNYLGVEYSPALMPAGIITIKMQALGREI